MNVHPINVRRAFALWLSAVLAIAATNGARAEPSVLRVSKSFGIHHPALYVMEKPQLVEKQAAAAGLGRRQGNL